ncbi:T9SS C-terminal target domain-containing protein [bacterium]|nr:MAG: T9SS C-terminal target domain-containing protein [bacterium]
MKNVLMICTKTALLSALLMLCTLAAFAAPDSRVEIPQEYQLSSSLPAELSAQLAAERAALQAELEAVKAEMNTAKFEGRNYDHLIPIAEAILNDLGVRNPRPMGEYTPSLDEGGESCTSGTVIPGLPYADAGNTCDNADDYAPTCYTHNNNPDVFYLYTPAATVNVRLSTCHTATDYDTGLYILDASGNEIACNDDYFTPECQLPSGQYFKSFIDCITLYAGETYCIGVDGFGWDPAGPNAGLRCGNYLLTIEECPCVECGPNDAREGEQACADGYLDDFNSGCNAVSEFGLPAPVFSPIVCNSTVCGTSGQYMYQGLPYRDTDWYLLVLTEETNVTWCVDAAFSPVIAIVASCDPLNVLAFDDTGVECEPSCVSACLPAGTYFLFVSTQFAGATLDVPCGSEYQARVTCSPCGEECVPEPDFVQVDLSFGLPWCECLYICPNVETTVAVGPGLGPNQQPVVNILPGCIQTAFGGCLDPDCPPAFPGPGIWVYDPAIGMWYYRFAAAPGTAPGCVCLCVERILPVELVGFDAIAGDREVSLNWSTASETNNDHFDILRNGTVVGRITAANSASGSSYNWTDSGLNNGRSYEYTLISVAVSGASEELATASATPNGSNATVLEYALHQNYPNPFNPETNITFDLVETSNVMLTVYNPMGQTVATLVSGELSAGRHSVSFSAADLPSGLYFYRMEAGEFSAVRKMILMK